MYGDSSDPKLVKARVEMRAVRKWKADEAVLQAKLPQ